MTKDWRRHTPHHLRETKSGATRISMQFYGVLDIIIVQQRISQKQNHTTNSPYPKHPSINPIFTTPSNPSKPSGTPVLSSLRSSSPPVKQHSKHFISNRSTNLSLLSHRIIIRSLGFRLVLLIHSIDHSINQQETMAKGRHSRMLSRRSSTFTLVLAMLLMLSFVLLMLLALGILSLPVNTNDAPKANDLSSVMRHTQEKFDGLGERGEQWTEILSWEPRAFLYHNFLSKDECEYLIDLAKPHMEKSTVVDSATGKSTDSRVRTSSGMFLRRGRDKIVRDIEKRIADFTFIPVEHGEGLQILHYEVGQKYEPHFDYFLDQFNTKNGGQRIATVLMYLSDVEEGGETVFPTAKGNISAVPWWDELSECGKKGLSVKPKRGDALLFWSMRPDATLDPSSLHGGCPVIRGNKWSSTKWLHVNEYKV